MPAYATITLELRKGGMFFICDETDTEVFVNDGDGNKLMDLLNETVAICHPDSRFSITEKGKEYLRQLKGEKEKRRNENR